MPAEAGIQAREGMDTGFRRYECAHESAASARWKSVSEEATTPKPKETASSRGEVESNLR